MNGVARTLSVDLIERIVAEARHVLATRGVAIEDPALLARFSALGLEVQGDRLLFSSEAIDLALKTSPSELVLHNRRGEKHAFLGGDRVHFVPASSALRFRDLDGSERTATTADLCRYTRLADALPNIDYLSTAFVTGDVPKDIADSWRLYCTMATSPLPVVSGAFTARGVQPMAELQLLFRDGADDLAARPLSLFTICPNTPLRWGADPLHNLVDCAHHGIPVEIVPVVLLGMVAPVSCAGALVVHTAEILSGLTLAQLLRPGLPVVFGAAPASFHMRYMTSPMAAAEAMQVATGSADIARYLELPSQAYIGLSDAPDHDAQAGAETGIGALLALQHGINSVSGPGMLDYVSCFSLEKLVFDDELITYAKRAVRPVREREDLPTTELLDELLSEGHLLMAEHTLDHWPDELLLHGPLFDRYNADQRQAAGSPSLRDRAQAHGEALLDAWEEPPIDAAVDREARRILLAASAANPTLPEV